LHTSRKVSQPRRDIVDIAEHRANMLKGIIPRFNSSVRRYTGAGVGDAVVDRASNVSDMAESVEASVA
jgi:hypothetical protein